MKLFTVGPVEMFQETLELSGKQLPYFRTNEFSEVMLDNERLFKKSIGAQGNDKTVFLTASGSGAMEATILNCFSRNDRVLVINGGTFGQRFVDICKVHGIPFDEISLSFDATLTLEMLEENYCKEHTALLVNIHETSNGKLYDIGMLSRFCADKSLFFVIDAISSYLADDINFNKYNVDALIVSSQKALALAPGISIVQVSEKLYEERIDGKETRTFYFDFYSHIKNLERGQTPFTPAVGILLELNQRLKQIDSIGVAEVVEHRKKMANMFRTEASKLGYEVPQYTLSNALTPLIVKPHAKQFYEILRKRYDMMVTPSGGSMADVLVRVGHLGNLEWKDYELLLGAMDEMRDELK